MMRRSLGTLMLPLALIPGFVAGCDSAGSPQGKSGEAKPVTASRLSVPSDGEVWRTTVSLVPPRTTGTFFTERVCVSIGPDVRVTKVAAVQPTGNLEVTDFRVYRFAPDDRISSWIPRPLSSTRAARESKTVRSRCGSRDSVVDYLVVEVRRPGSRKAEAAQFRLEYNSGKGVSTVTMPVGITICPERRIVKADCVRA